MPKPKPNYEYTQRRIPVDLWPEVAKMIEDYKQRMKGGPIKNTCTDEKIKLDTPDQIVFYPLMNQPLKQQLGSDTVILDGNREVTTPVKFTAYNHKEVK